MSVHAPLKLALVTTGDPEDPAVSSSVPSSLLAALREVVETTVAISDAPPARQARAALALGGLRGLRLRELLSPADAKTRLRTVGQASRQFATARRRTARRRLAAVDDLDGLIQMGADYPAPSGVPMVTRQDSTVIQAVKAYPWPHLSGLSQRDIDGLVRRQRAAYESAVACCAVTHWVADSIVTSYGIPKSKVHVIGTGANHMIPAEETPNRDWSAPRFLFVGIDWQRKNGPATVAAFSDVRRQFPEARLDIVGDHPRVDVDGVTGHGRLAIDDTCDRTALTDLYRRATAFVLPSVHEPAGAVYVEAASAGIASIGTRNGGAATLIGDAGHVVDPDERGQIVSAMLELCDPTLAQTLGTRARERAELFTWRKVAERLVRAFGFPTTDLSGYADFL